MPISQPDLIAGKTSAKNTPVKTANKAAIAKAFDNKSSSVQQRVKQWQEQGGGTKQAANVPKTASAVSKVVNVEPARAVAVDVDEIIPSLNTKDEPPFGTQVAAADSQSQGGGADEGEKSQASPGLRVIVKPKTATGKKKEISATRLRIAQAIVGPTVRPSERLRRLSEAKREKETQLAATAAAAVTATTVAADGHEKKGKGKAELGNEACKPESKRKEPATPRKRSVSDKHWRGDRSVTSSAASEKVAHHHSTPRVEGWLTSISLKTSPVDYEEGTAATSVSDSERRQDADDQILERRRKRRQRLEARRLSRIESGRPVNGHDDGCTETSGRHGAEMAERESAMSGESCLSNGDRARERIHLSSCLTSSRTHSDVDIASGTVSAEEKKTSDSSGLANETASLISGSSCSSETEEWDQLTSISRRPPQKSMSVKSTKNILVHAARLFTRQDNRPSTKVAIAASSPAPPVPTIENWLEHTEDPFLDQPAPSEQHQEIRSFDRVTESQQTMTEEIRGGYGDVPSSQPTQGLSDIQELIDGQDTSRKRRLRRVLRHRDGTVTVDHDASTDEIKRLSPPLSQLEHYDQVIKRDYLDAISGPKNGSLNTESPAAQLRADFLADTYQLNEQALSRTKNVGRNSTPKLLSDNHHDIHVLRRLDRGSARLAKHSDLISILSGPQSSSKSIRSARSIRTRRSRPGISSITEILHEFATDESKYTRELRTLVDGVIPVLLSSVSSQEGVGAVTGSSGVSSTSDHDNDCAKAILAMGVSIAALKDHHDNFTAHKPEKFLAWAEGAAPLYRNFITVWRMGFQDIVVNLASQEDTDDDKILETSLSPGLGRSVLDANSERVDVAYLLKRPLVRLKYMSKSLRSAQQIASSPRYDDITRTFQRLVDEARRRSNEERARLEDEAAAAIDTKKARDPCTLLPLENVFIEHASRVKARDGFDLELFHSTGQRMDCRAELFLREDDSGVTKETDLLIAEIDGAGRWLLFPPINIDCVSARTGDHEGEIVVMIRGNDGRMILWQEIISLTAEDERTASEWVQMLGLQPIPPPLESIYVFTKGNTPLKSIAGSEESDIIPENDLRSGSLQDQAPIGENPIGYVRRWRDTTASRTRKRLSRNSPSTIMEETQSALAHDASSQLDSSRNAGVACVFHGEHYCSDSSRIGRAVTSMDSTPLIPMATDKNDNDTRVSPLVAPKRYSKSSNSEMNYGEESYNERDRNLSVREAVESETVIRTAGKSARPQITSPKPRPARYHARKDTLSLAQHSKDHTTAREAQVDDPRDALSLGTEISAVVQPTAADSEDDRAHIGQAVNSHTPTPVHEASGTTGMSKLPDLSYGQRRLRKRTSSPLKHEYAPSSASDSSSESSASTVVNDFSSTSDSSDCEFGEDTQSVLVPMSAVRRYRKTPRTTPAQPLAEQTLSPSQSASQAPYREVPLQLGKASQAIATISYWSDQGFWDELWPGECLIIISPGLIEAYEVGEAEQSLSSVSKSDNSRFKPLVGLELTPLVPIRRGTALDISIRSPPTSDSRAAKSRGNSNFLFRSRTPEDCEILYRLINHSRIHNPTYIALQNARATSFNPQFQGFDRRSGSRISRTSSWFGLGGRKASYRASSMPAMSVSRNTESSVGSLSSAFSAFRNFSRVSTRFNIAKSTVISRQGDRSISLHSSSDATGSAGALNSGQQIEQPLEGALGLNNCKIRLYIRESTSKWADLGSARLTIMKPSTPFNGTVSDVAAPDVLSSVIAVERIGADASAGHGIGMIASGGYASPGNRVSANDKRILVTASSKGIMTLGEQPRTLLDVTLGETCFERVARTGIAVSVWENFEGGMVAKHGGVVGGRLKVYMMQFKNEADTAYTYSIVGKLRY